MSGEKVKKIDWGYTLIYIFAPIVLIVVGTFLAVKLMPDSSAGPFIPMVLFLLSMAWWLMGGRNALKNGANKLAKEMDAQGLTRNMTFNGRGCVVVVDTVHGKLGLVYAWNPRKQYIIPASRVEKAWVDDGRSGKGITEGSGRVSFLFTVDGVKNRVDTFASNTRFKMNDNRILTGISKADSMVELINAAKEAAR